MNLKDIDKWDWTGIRAHRHYQRDEINLEDLYEAFKERLLKEIEEDWKNRSLDSKEKR